MCPFSEKKEKNAPFCAKKKRRKSAKTKWRKRTRGRGKREGPLRGNKEKRRKPPPQMRITVLLLGLATCAAAAAAETPARKSNEEPFALPSFEGSFPFFSSYGESQERCPSVPIAVDATHLLRNRQTKQNNGNREKPNLPAPLASAVASAERLLDSLVSGKDNNIATGLTAGAMYAGELLWTAGLGRVNTSSAAPPPSFAQSVFRIGSVTKVFTAAMVYQLASSGALRSVDDALSAYNSGFSMRDPFSTTGSGDTGATFRQVLSQLGGMPREPPCDLKKIGGWSCNETTETMLGRLRDMSYILPRNTRPSYSNLGFSLAGNIAAESVASPPTTFSDYVFSRILQPLGLKLTAVELSQKIAAALVPGYRARGDVAPPYSNGWNSPAGQMFSTSADMLTFLDSVFASTYQPPYANTPNVTTQQANPAIGVRAAREMLAPLFANPGGQSFFGSPWQSYPMHNVTVHSKGGNVPGYSALAVVVPELRFSLAVHVNGPTNEELLLRPLMDLFLPALTESLAAVQPVLPVFPPGGSDNQLVGTFTSQVGTTFTVSAATVRGQSYLLLQWPGTGHIPLTWASATATETSTQIYLPAGALGSCMNSELAALGSQEVLFHTPNGAGSVATSVTMFGYFPGQVFARTSR
jgi:CubicO group peptidase (beta-lactamase class C family)